MAFRKCAQWSLHVWILLFFIKVKKVFMHQNTFFHDNFPTSFHSSELNVNCDCAFRIDMCKCSDWLLNFVLFKKTVQEQKLFSINGWGLTAVYVNAFVLRHYRHSEFQTDYILQIIF